MSDKLKAIGGVRLDPHRGEVESEATARARQAMQAVRMRMIGDELLNELDAELAKHQAAIAAAIARGEIDTAIMRGRMLRGQAIAAWAERQRVDLWALVLAAAIITAVAVAFGEDWGVWARMVVGQ